MTLRALLPATLAVVACGGSIAPGSTSDGHGADGVAGTAGASAGNTSGASTGVDTSGSTTGSGTGDGTPLLANGDCTWRRLDPDELCVASPCAITDVLRLECEGDISGVSLRADDELVRIGYRKEESYSLFDLSSGDVEPVEVPMLAGEVATWLASPTAIVHPVEDRFTLFSEQSDGTWSPRDLALVGGSLVDARVLDGGELRLLFNQPGIFDATVAREVDRWDGGSVIEVDGLSGSGALTAEGTLVSPRYYSALGVSLWTETTTSSLRLLPASVSQGTAVASGEEGELVFVSAVRYLDASAPTSRLEVLTREEQLVSLASRQSLSAPGCSGESTDVICPDEVETYDLGSELGRPRSLTTSHGSWVAVTTRFGNATCAWHAVNCTSSGFCSHERGCERMGRTTHSTSVDIYATDRPGAASLHIPPRFGDQPQLTAGARGDTLYLSLHRGDTLHVVTIDAALLPRGPTEPTEELPVSPEPVEAVVSVGGATETPPCDESLLFADPEGDSVDVTPLSQIHAQQMVAHVGRAGAPEQGLVLLTTATGDFVAGNTRVEVPEDRMEIVTRVAADGAIAWATPRFGATALALTPDGDTVVVGGPRDWNGVVRNAAHVALLGAGGELKWERFYGETDVPFRAVAVLADGKIIASAGGQQLFELSSEGLPVSRLDLPFLVYAVETTSDDRVVLLGVASETAEWGESTIPVDGNPGLVAVMDSNLEPLWAAGLPDRPQSLSVLADDSVWAYGGATVYRVDSSGAVAMSFPGFSSYAHVAGPSSGTALVAGYDGNRVRLTSFDDEGTELTSTSFDAAALGNRITLSPLGSDQFLAVTGIATCEGRHAVAISRLRLGPL